MIAIIELLNSCTFYQPLSRLAEALTISNFCEPSKPDNMHTQAIIL